MGKLKEWVRRYWLAETISLLAGLLLTSASYFLLHSVVLSGFFGSFVETAVFYGIMFSKDLSARKRNDHARFGIWSVAKVVRNIILEFGTAEYLDTFVIRPFYLSVFPLFVKPYVLAILLATLLADVTFYLPTIFSYELRKKHLDD